ncbi:enoyl-CoA hydratase [Candidatus Magnetomorum sp. HK-1]|nr:enoyl-CoA hydratase [Candidatus Magnetomorum sp. HK-1]
MITNNYEDIRLDVTNNIAVLTLNRPDIRNAFTQQQIINDICQALDEINVEPDIHVLIITGADPSFSAGGNIKDMAVRSGMFSGTPEQIKDNYKNFIQKIPLAFHRLDVPTIAAVNGPAIGAGCDLALMCDMRVASKRAKFAESFINVGLIPGDGGAYFLQRIVGLPKALELTMTGDIVDANEALNLGMVNRVVPHEKLMEETMTLAQKLADKPKSALRMSKRLIYMAQDMSLEQVLEQSATYQALCHQTDEHKDAVKGFLEKWKNK